LKAVPVHIKANGGKLDIIAAYSDSTFSNITSSVININFDVEV
jgi:hypothetical protein